MTCQSNSLSPANQLSYMGRLSQEPCSTEHSSNIKNVVLDSPSLIRNLNAQAPIDRTMDKDT
ncbi:multidrug resistance protein cdr1 [Moniliophthora roreri]|nr:multidrug resistance protein cdr1 [Moniliophthora roreri]